MLRGEKNRQKGPFFLNGNCTSTIFILNNYYPETGHLRTTKHEVFIVSVVSVSAELVLLKQCPFFNKLKRNIERCIKEKIHTYEVLAVVSTFGHLSDPFSSPQELILVIINFFFFFFLLWSFALNAVLVVLIFFLFFWMILFFFKVSKWWYI